MGNEAVCRVKYKGEATEAKVLLETEEIIIRSPLRLKIPFGEIEQMAADAKSLRFVWHSDPIDIDLGSDAAKWAEKIRNPKSRADKLGIKAGQKIAISGTVDADFRRELTGRGAVVSNRMGKENDIIFFAAAHRSDLAELPSLKAALVPNGAIWIIRPKGTPDISDADVISAGKRAGLVDVKVARFSATHTAEKLVIPVTKR